MSAVGASCVGLTFTTSSTLVIACVGDSTGSATLSSAVGGGSGNYSYLWSPGGETTVFKTNLAAGTTTLTITDLTNGCDTVISFTIATPDPVIATVANIPTCNGVCTSSALLVADGGDAGPGNPFTYALVGPTVNDSLFGSIDSVDIITGLCPGPYTFVTRLDVRLAAQLKSQKKRL